MQKDVHLADEAAEISAAVAGQTVASWFGATVARRPDATALVDGTTGRTWTWARYGEDAARVAAGLAALGVGRGDRVALMMRNRPEFHLADVGALLLAATPYSIYNSSPPPQVEYLLSHSGARVVIVEDAEFLGRILAVRDRLPALEHIVVLDSDAAGGAAIAFDDLLDTAPLDLEAACAVASPEDIATLVYTSGTTGPPKGAMCGHDRICWMIESFRRRMDVDMEGGRIVSYLPMAHILERDVSHWLHILTGAEVTTCSDPTALGPTLRAVRPHFFAAVPRVWEKLASAIRAAGPMTPEEARTALGLDACLSAFSGGAPLPGETHEFLLGLGIPLGEGYGLTESTFVVTFDAVAPRVGAVGRAVPGVELAIAEDGEVLARGPFVFKGYLNDEARTRDAIDDDGWLHTGDIGTIDDDGYLRIVDRKKELIITAGGKNISPANLEASLKAHPLIGQVCVVGDRRPFLVALVVLDTEVAPGWARERDIAATDLADLAADPVVREAVVAAVAAVNATVSRVERIKRIALLHEEWLPDSEELTPTMKLKRRGILARHASVIDALYDADPGVAIDVPDAAPTTPAAEALA